MAKKTVQKHEDEYLHINKKLGYFLFSPIYMFIYPIIYYIIFLFITIVEFFIKTVLVIISPIIILIHIFITCFSNSKQDRKTAKELISFNPKEFASPFINWWE